MVMSNLGCCLSSLLLAAVLANAQWTKTPLEAPSVINPNLYRANANATREIHEALVAARKQHKRVLLVFGANWCIDCHVLERAFHQPRIEPLLLKNFALVHVDVGRYDKNLQLANKYHADLHKGVPSIAVLSSAGALLHSSSEFEKARLLTEQDVIDFLDTWRPRPGGARNN
jgi:thiol:disulfide interchange protein